MRRGKLCVAVVYLWSLALGAGTALGGAPFAPESYGPESNVSAAGGYQGVPAAALDPANDSRLMIVGEDDSTPSSSSWFSSDGGSTFARADLPLIFASHTYNDSFAPEPAADLSGTWYAAYIADDQVLGSPTNTSVVVATSSNGTAWTAAGIIAGPSASTYGSPAIAVDTERCSSPYKGYVYVSWVQRTATADAVYLSRSSNGGTTWSTPVKVSDGTGATEVLRRPRVAIGPAGVVYVAWLDLPHGKIFIDSSSDGGSTFGTDRTVRTLSSTCSGDVCGSWFGCLTSGTYRLMPTASLAVDRSSGPSRGTIYVAYNDDDGAAGSGVYWTRSSDGGAVWAAPGKLNAAPPFSQPGPAIAVAPGDGSVHVAWYDIRGTGGSGFFVYYSRSADSGAHWTAEVVSTAFSCYGTDTHGATVRHLGLVVGDAFARPVWTDNRAGGNYEIYTAKKTMTNGTHVSGVISADTTWTVAGSPYTMTGDVTVESGAKLTIQPGVTVRVATCDDTQGGNDGGRVELIVRGSLDAQGTSGGPISFDSGATTPAAGDWSGVRFDPTANSVACKMSYFTVAHASTGIVLNGVSPVLDHVTIQSVSQYGLQGSTSPTILFSPKALSISQTPNSALYLSTGGGTWNGLSITGCAGGAGTLSGGGLPLRIVGANVDGNGGGGLVLNSYGSSAEIIRSAFTNNGGTGLWLVGTGARTLASNDIHGNTQYGLRMQDSSSPWPNVALYRNNIYGNGLDLEEQASSIPIDARRNWWGAASTAQMAANGYPSNVSAIRDIHDDASLRHVDFDLWEAAPLPVGPSATTLESYLVVPTTLQRRQPVRIYGAAVADAGVQRVQVSTDAGATWQDAAFQGSAFYFDWFPVPGTYTVLSRVTDANNAVEAIPDTRTVTVTSGPTTSGSLTADETWSGTVVLDGDVTVPNGVTLTITPGTQVRAKYLTDATFGGVDPSRIEIIVAGVLVGNGTGVNRASFDSTRGPGQPGDWYGIRYLDTTTDTISILQYCDIDHGVRGVSMESAAPDVKYCNIRNGSSDGLSGTSGGIAKAQWDLSGNTITGNAGNGISLTSQTAVILNGGTASTNSQSGISLNANSYRVDLLGVTVQNNGGAGVTLQSGNVGVTIKDSHVLNNNGAGINIGQGGNEVRIERSEVAGNIGAGITVSSANTAYLLKTTVTGNARALDIGTPRLIAAYSSLSGNCAGGVCDTSPTSGGAALRYAAYGGTPAVIGMSTLENQGAYEIVQVFTGSVPARAVNARRNWWGISNTVDFGAAGYPANIARIFDVHDDGNTGLVDYSNWMAAAGDLRDPGDLAAHITYPQQGAVLNRRNLLITGVAYAKQGIDRVEVSTDGGLTWGLATGAEAWTFSWFSPYAPVPTGFNLKVRVTDRNAVVSVPDETIAVTLTQNAPTASGQLVTDETWGPGATCPSAPCDVILTGDVIVPSGRTLTINPGTIVKALPLTDDRLGGNDPSRIEIIVQGTLIVNGTSLSRVVFTSYGATPQPRDWAGLRYEDTADDAADVMTYADIRAAWHGIEFWGGTTPMTGVTSRNNYGSGLRVYQNAFAMPSTVSILGGSFSNNGGSGVELSGTGYGTGTTIWTFDGVTTESNGGAGIGGYWPYCADSFQIKNSTVRLNGQGGISLYEPYYYCGYAAFALYGSSVTQNSSLGVYVPAQAAEIFGNTLSDNRGVALTLPFAYTQTAELIYKNTFSLNDQNVSFAGTGLVMVYNDLGATSLTNLQSSVSVPAKVNYNNIPAAASGYLMALSTPASVNAWANYWGPATTVEMTGAGYPAPISTLLDIEDNPSLGRIDYSRFLAAPVNLATTHLSNFTNPQDGASLTGASFNLQGVAGASAGIDHVEVSITHDGDPDGPWGTVAGTASWSTTWAPMVSGAYTLRCRVVDRTGTPQAAPTAIHVTVYVVNVTTSGTLTTDETWSGTITLTGDVTVPPGITLTVLPGAVIKATANSDDQFGGVDTSRIELIVQGKLVAQGAAGNPVTFTSTAPIPAKANWYGIRFDGNAVDSTSPLTYLVIEWGRNGISSTNSGAYPDITDSTIRHMSEAGISLSPGSNGPAPPPERTRIRISRNTIQDAVGYATLVYYYGNWSGVTWEFSGNTVSDCYSGFYFADLSGPVSALEIKNNQVASCPGGAINVYGRVAVDEIDDNTITDSGAAITTSSGTQVYVRRNVVTGGSSGYGAGTYEVVHVEGNTFTGGTSLGVALARGELIRNEIRNYGGAGISASFVGGYDPPVLLYNNVHDNGKGILGYGARGYWNRFANDLPYEAESPAYVPYGSDLRRNCWESLVGEMTSYPKNISGIYDIEDDQNRARVDYNLWLPYRPLDGTCAEPWPTVPESRFVWPATGMALSRHALRIEGTAYAPNGVQLVEVSADGGTTWLPATGTYYWTSDYTPPAAGSYTLKSRVTAIGGAVETTPDTVTFTVSDAIPTTSGTLFHDETWTPAQGAITLTGDVIVPPGTTLTILPGTVIRAQALTDDLHGGVDTSRIELIVQGKLVAQGAAGNPVTFTSTAPIPAKANWYGIRFDGNAVDSTSPLTYLVIEWGRNGISSTNSGAYPDITDSTIRHMSEAGISLSPGSNGPAPPPERTRIRISRNTIQDAVGYATLVYYYGNWSGVTWEFSGNTVSDCYSGFYFADLSGPVSALEIKNNQVASCPGGAINVYGRVAVDEIDDNTITDSGAAITTSSGTQVYVRRNVVTGGSSGYGAGTYEVVHVEGNTFTGGTSLGVALARGELIRNEIRNYGGAGISASFVGGYDPPVLLYNNVHDNGKGILGYGARGYWNRFANDLPYEAESPAYVPYGSDLRRNCWESLVGEMTSYPKNISGIYDIEDDQNRARVDYNLWLPYRPLDGTCAEPWPTVPESRFVWPATGMALSRHALRIEGTAYAPNGIQLVEVSTDGGTTWLPTTGAYYWTFDYTPPAAGSYTLKSRVMAIGGAVETTPDTVSFTVNDALPTTTGTLARDETWSGTVVLTGDVIVPTGRTLTIQPGTNVRAQAWTDDLRGGLDSSRIELIVSGSLVASGTTGSRIGITSASATPTRGQWYGLRYEGPSVAAESVQGVDVSYAVNGISSAYSALGTRYPDVIGCSVTQVSGDGISMYLGGPTVKSKWNLTGTSITNVNGNAVLVSDYNASPVTIKLDQNTLSGFGQQGVVVYGGGASSPLTATFNTVSASGSANGLTIYGSSVNPRTVTDNTIQIAGGGTGVALYLADTLSANVSRNYISGGTYGIQATQAYGGGGTVDIKNNQITGATTAGLSTNFNYSSLRFQIFENDVRSNPGVGVQLTGSVAPTVNRNNLEANQGGYDLQNLSTMDVDASQNYWGTATLSEIIVKGCSANIDKIYDRYDNPSDGVVTYCQPLTSPTDVLGDQATITFAKITGGREIRWTPKPGKTYDLIQGDTANFARSGVTIALGLVTCERQSDATGAILDTSSDPPIGKRWFYLLRDHRPDPSSAAHGAYGFASDGSREVPASGDCP